MKQNAEIRANAFLVAKMLGTLIIVFSAFVFALRAGLPIQAVVFFAVSYIFIKTFKSVLYGFRYREIASAALAGVLSLSWIIFPSLVVQDITALCLAGAIFYQCYELKITFREALIFGAAVIPFDVLMVFGTGFMVEFVMRLHAGATPLAISVSPEIRDIIGLSVLGLGDIILPGLVVLGAWSKGKELQRPLLGVGAFMGYFAGLFAVIAAVNFFQYPQPATMYLYPGVLLGVWMALLKYRLSWAALFV